MTQVIAISVACEPELNVNDTPILEMQHITKEFPGVKALDDVSFQVYRGEIHCLVGENGAGKSTLMKVLSGVYPHGEYSGDILFGGEIQTFGGIRDSERIGIGIIYQELALFPEVDEMPASDQLGLLEWLSTTHRRFQLLARADQRQLQWLQGQFASSPASAIVPLMGEDVHDLAVLSRVAEYL